MVATAPSVRGRLGLGASARQHAEAAGARDADDAWPALARFGRLVDGAMAHLELDQGLADILEGVRGRLPAAVVSLWVPGAETARMHLKARQGLEPAGPAPASDKAVARALARGRLVVAQPHVPRPGRRDGPVAGEAAVPLVHDAQVVAVLHVQGLPGRALRRHHLLDLQGLADGLAPMVARARLLDRDRDVARARGLLLANASARKTLILNMAGHDLRTPLYAMRLQTLWLDIDTPAPATVRREALATLVRNLERLGGLLDDLLELGRMEVGAFVMHPQTVDVPTILGEVCTTFAATCEDAGLGLVRDLGPARVFTDEGRLHQVAMNLVSNAVRYTPPGGTIKVACRSDARHVEVLVRDTGAGLTAGQMGSLFQPYHQVHGSFEERQGSGLGLFITKLLVEAQGGTIAVQSDGPGMGSAFTVRLAASPGRTGGAG